MQFDEDKLLRLHENFAHLQRTHKVCWTILNECLSPRVVLLGEYIMAIQLGRNSSCPKCQKRIADARKEYRLYFEETSDKVFIIFEGSFYYSFAKVANNLEKLTQFPYFAFLSFGLNREEAKLLFWIVREEDKLLMKFQYADIKRLGLKLLSKKYYGTLEDFAKKHWQQPVQFLASKNFLTNKDIESSELLNSLDDIQREDASFLLSIFTITSPILLKKCLKLKFYDEVRRFIEKGADIRAVEYPLIYLPGKAPRDFVLFLIKQGANPNAPVIHASPILSALRADEFEIFKSLIEDGKADISETARILYEICRETKNLKKWMDVVIANRKTDKLIETGLVLSLAQQGCWDTLMQLLEANVNVNRKNSVLQTPLHHAAAFCKNEAVVEKLVRKGARIDAEDNAGDTPLHWAAYYSNIVGVRKLIELKADKTYVNKSGQTPSDVAKQKGHDEVCVFLRGIPMTLKSACIRFIAQNMHLYMDFIQYLPDEIQERFATQGMFVNSTSPEEKRNKCRMM